MCDRTGNIVHHTHPVHVPPGRRSTVNARRPPRVHRRHASHTPRPRSAARGPLRARSTWGGRCAAPATGRRTSATRVRSTVGSPAAAAPPTADGGRPPPPRTRGTHGGCHATRPRPRRGSRRRQPDEDQGRDLRAPGATMRSDGPPPHRSTHHRRRRTAAGGAATCSRPARRAPRAAFPPATRLAAASSAI